ncbi:nucleoside triphosphate pyrophosphohydrolase [Candidatus Pacearchaeota archaeon]|nr:nucleoside triphosphate pyrophosphohydrolase [Candidatus Pacearchaeota archaeon]
MKYDKLVRDKIPEILKSKGVGFLTTNVSGQKYKQKLYDKLNEEVDEYLESKEIEELADIFEVIEALCFVNNTTLKDLFKIKQDKQKERGGFKDGIVLLKTD